jgi:soluble lytic murein transglycosylase-like protein
MRANTSNNNSGQDDDLIIAITYKESGFDPTAQSTKSSAGGLMGLTDLAISDLQSRYDGFDSIDKYDPAQNIDAATQYLQLRIQWTNGDVAKALAGYGTGNAYAQSVLNAASALRTSPDANPMNVLRQKIGPR